MHAPTGLNHAVLIGRCAGRFARSRSTASTRAFFTARTFSASARVTVKAVGVVAGGCVRAAFVGGRQPIIDESTSRLVARSPLTGR